MPDQRKPVYRNFRLYKIGFKRKRKDARRHLLTRFYSSSDYMAVREMLEILKDYDIVNYEYRLYTGNWIEVSMCSNDCSACPNFQCPENEMMKTIKEEKR